MSIYSWGRNRNGELGVATSQKDEWAPKAVQVSHVASSLAAGGGHSLFSTEAGDVFSCGCGRQGQLGLPTRDNKLTPTHVVGLSHESVIRVAASGVSSFAITATGRVYHWGLVHRPTEPPRNVGSGENEKEANSSSLEPFEQVTAGQLTGLAENQEDVIVHVDNEARAHIQNQDGPQYASRQLKDIVTSSTERWMLSNDDADAEYYRELQSMGYEKEALDERMQSRGREYHGMLRVQCRRTVVPSPELISSLAHVKVVSLAAGFAHCIALTDQGSMYSCGYNDRGQLGLGHRISCSDFRVVDYMAGKAVLQVECGQQHSMCRAVDRVRAGTEAVSATDRAGMGAAVFVWGNGMLGQLGLGLKGTSKGRLLPTLLTTLCDVAPLGAIDISAGDNFSVAVGVDGTTFSWGHAEYNQHGSTMVGGSDYVDNYHYFVPRLIPITDKHGTPEKLVQVSCGSNFTVGVTEGGDVYSWGWHAYGVLGHGKGYFGQSALKITSLGQMQIDRSVVRVCAGSSHVLAITSSSGNAWAKTFQRHLIPPSPAAAKGNSVYDGDTFSDAEIVDESSGTVFPCHRVILAARSSYLAGYLRASEAANRGRCGVERGCSKEQICLDSGAADATTIQFLLQYIYTDTLSAPTHKRKQLADLAEAVAMHRLASLCRHHGAYGDRQTDTPVPPSTFEDDMQAMVKNDLFSDCKFIVHSVHDGQSEGSDADAEVIQLSDSVIVPGHKLLFARMPYFSNLFSGNFSDGYIESDGTAVYDLAGFLLDGINMDSFQRLVTFTYSGASSVLDVEDSEDLTGLLIASNRVGLSPLTALCEKKLSLHLNDFPENIENCLAFAQMYNIPRLSRQCEELMRLSSLHVSSLREE